MTLDQATCSVHKRLWREATIAARFGLVGIAATSVHILVAYVLLSETLFPTLLANTLAFLTAFSISFSANYIWTFQSPGNPRRAVRRFLLISVSAFAISTLSLAVILSAQWLTPFFAVTVSSTVMPLITFLVCRLWGFQCASHGNSPRS